MGIASSLLIAIEIHIRLFFPLYIYLYLLVFLHLVLQMGYLASKMWKPEEDLGYEKQILKAIENVVNNNTSDGKYGTEFIKILRVMYYFYQSFVKLFELV